MKRETLSYSPIHPGFLVETSAESALIGERIWRFGKLFGANYWPTLYPMAYHTAIKQIYGLQSQWILQADGCWLPRREIPHPTTASSSRLPSIRAPLSAVAPSSEQFVFADEREMRVGLPKAHNR
jgi:hypothetical protein